MKKVVYIAPVAVNHLGRFGRVEPGQVLEFFEWEFDYVCRDGSLNYALPEDAKKTSTRPVKLERTNSYDLTRVNWNDWRAVAGIPSRTMPELRKMAAALNELRIRLVFDMETTREELADKIILAAKRAEWMPESELPEPVAPEPEPAQPAKGGKEGK